MSNFSTPAHTFLTLMFSLCLIQKIYAADLTADQSKALENAVKYGGYTSEVITLPTSGQKKTIVLLGETHVKNKSSSELGIAVLNQFPFRGLEGISPSEWEEMKRESFFNKWYLEYYSWVINLSKSNKVINKSTVYEARDVGLSILSDNEVLWNGKTMGRLNEACTSGDVKLRTILASLCLDRLNIEVGVDERAIQPPENSLHNLNIGLEYGSLSQWSSICQEYYCEKHITLRDYRFASNIKKLIGLFPQYNTLLVIVGSDHIKGIKRNLIGDTSSKKVLKKKSEWCCSLPTDEEFKRD